MNGTDYQLIVQVLVVLIYLKKYNRLIPKKGGVYLDRLDSR